MTIPMAIMLISGVFWLAFVVARTNSGGHWIYDWFVEVCRIVFAVSAFWVVAGLAGKAAF